MNLEKFIQYIQQCKSKDILKIIKDLNIKDYELYGLVEMAKRQGYMIDIIDGKIVKIKPEKENDIYQIKNNLEHLKLLLLSDTHLASKYDRLDILRYLYKKAEDNNVNYILHSGDLTEGRSNRPEQIYQLKEASFEGQRDYVIDKYPKSNIPTYIIAGNHDLWWVKQCGSDIVNDICKNREDMIYLGSDCEDMKIGNLRIRLFHGKGGVSYAKSYKVQKYLDTIPQDELPDILQTGHIHSSFYLKQGKTNCIQTGCLQDLTPYERSMGFSDEKSVWWADVYFNDKGKVQKIDLQLESFDSKKKTLKI